MTYRAPFLDVDAYIDGKDQSIATTDFSYHFASCVILNILNEMEDCWDLSELPSGVFEPEPDDKRRDRLITLLTWYLW